MTGNSMDLVFGGTGFLDDLEQSITAANKTARAKQEAGKFYWKFRMPDVTEKDGSRRADIRFLVSWGNGAIVLEHQKFQVVQTVCPRMYGKDCQYCAMDENKLKAMGIKTNKIYLWPVWDASANEGKGEVRLFAYPINNASPVPKLSRMLQLEREQAEEEGREPRDITTFDTVIIQEGDSKTRSFSTQPKHQGTRPFQHWKEVQAKFDVDDRQLMIDSYTYSLKDARHLLGDIGVGDDADLDVSGDIADDDSDLAAQLNAQKGRGRT